MNGPMPAITLKVDVDTWRGTREGVPRLMEALARHGARATFLFSLGPDHTGRAIKRVFRPGFFSKVQRTSVLSHYGLKTLLYGTLLPGPDIGRREAALLRRCRDAGFEVGIHTWDHILWQDHVRTRDPEWTRRQMQRAADRFAEVFGTAPATHGAAGWQMNDAAFLEEERLGLRYASDGRGTGPFRPRVAGRVLGCIQIPTSLPTLDELIGVDGLGEHNVAEHLLGLTGRERRDHVYTLHAELEGGKLLGVFERMLAGWRAQGYALDAMADAYSRLDADRLPVCEPRWGSVPGRSGELIVQG